MSETLCRDCGHERDDHAETVYECTQFGCQCAAWNGWDRDEDCDLVEPPA